VSPSDNQKLLITSVAPVRTWKNCIEISGKTQDQKRILKKKTGIYPGTVFHIRHDQAALWSLFSFESDFIRHGSKL